MSDRLNLPPVPRPPLPPVLTVPLPPVLAVPLPPGAEPFIALGDRVAAGQPLGGGDEYADTLAPASGEVTEIAHRPLATTPAAATLCVILNVLSHDKPVASHRSTDFLTLLKNTGIVGLGGGAFPAWRKWRRNLNVFIANAVESDPLSYCDAALLTEYGDNILTAVRHIGAHFADRTLLALRQNTALPLTDPMIRRVADEYAVGNERLLIEEITDIRLPRRQTPADCGAVCFNIATVMAMAAALHDGTAMTARLITVHDGGNVRVVQVPFGISIGTLRHFLTPAKQSAFANGDFNHPLTEDSVIAPVSTVISFGKRTGAAVLPCIRCGACEPVCPANLSPQRLHRAGLAGKPETLAAERLEDCLECRRCDAVCPSAIPLTAGFTAYKRRLAEENQRQQRNDRRRLRYDKHLRRQQAATVYLDTAQLKPNIADIVKETLKNHRKI